ncbi:MAG: MFS transporter [Flavobacteriales bacterium]|nr:MFS transporter [Flavobacteriales bacterium]
MKNPQLRIWITVMVASMGYFVDIFDLQLFNIVSKDSLRGIGIVDEEVIKKYDYILFLWQMGGMLAGGILWGVLGDLKGRKSILFGSILLYSIANIANAFVVNLDQYIVVRFFAGLGLAGELGAAITLVSEIMHKEKRGYGTMVIVTMGALGAVAAAQLKNANVEAWGFANWQMMYLIGGVLGLLLLLMRVGTFESGMFDTMKKSSVTKGNFFMLFANRKRFFRYLACILIGLPVWYCIGVLMKFADKFAIDLGVTGEKITVPNAIMYAYIGLSVGDLLSGILSQVFRSRKKIVLAYLIGTIVIVPFFLYYKGMSSSTFYFLCFLLGTATGYWALFVTMASEQFGTNIRATVTTTVPNFVRGANIPIIASYVSLSAGLGNIDAALTVGMVCVGLALIALYSVPETFGKDLNYAEIS